MEEDILGQYIKEIHKTKREIMDALAEVTRLWHETRTIRNEMVDLRHGIDTTKDELIAVEIELNKAKADIVILKSKP